MLLRVVHLERWFYFWYIVILDSIYLYIHPSEVGTGNDVTNSTKLYKSYS